MEFFHSLIFSQIFICPGEGRGGCGIEQGGGIEWWDGVCLGEGVSAQRGMSAPEVCV